MNNIENEMEKVFGELGFTPIMINDIRFMKIKESYCKLTYINEWNAYVIESADNYEEAKKGILEDGDLYDANMPVEELLKELRKELINDFVGIKI